MNVWSNVVALVGVLCVLVAVFGLAGVWWALLVTGLLLVLSAWAMWTQAAPDEVGEGG